MRNNALTLLVSRSFSVGFVLSFIYPRLPHMSPWEAFGEWLSPYTRDVRKRTLGLSGRSTQFNVKIKWRHYYETQYPF